MAISDEQYQKLAEYIVQECTPAEVRQILSGDFSAFKELIVNELLLNDYQGTILDIVFEDLFTQKKKPILKSQFKEFADFLMSDMSLIYLKHNLSKLVNK